MANDAAILESFTQGSFARDCQAESDYYCAMMLRADQIRSGACDGFENESLEWCNAVASALELEAQAYKESK